MYGQQEISRVTRSKQQAIAAYDRLSRWYDWFSNSSEQPLAELGLKKLNAHAGETVLEIGFGTGHALLALAVAVGDSGRVVGIDISRGMFKVASKRIAHENLSGRVILEQGDAAALSFSSDSFDAIFISFTLELFDTPEIATVLSECQRVLRQGGRIGVVAIVRDVHENIPLRIYEWFHQYLPAYVDCRPIYVQSALASAGFHIQDITRRWMWGLPVEICISKSMKGDGMTNSITSNQPRGVLRFLFRLPILLYRAHMGWLLGGRFLMLTHIGRRSGQLRQVMLEVVMHEPDSKAYFVAAGWRGKADWFRNIQTNPAVQVVVGTRTFKAIASVVQPNEAADRFYVYARRFPLAFRELSRIMMGKMVQSTREDCLRLAQSVPLVKLMPIQPAMKE